MPVVWPEKHNGYENNYTIFADGFYISYIIRFR